VTDAAMADATWRIVTNASGTRSWDRRNVGPSGHSISIWKQLIARLVVTVKVEQWGGIWWLPACFCCSRISARKAARSRSAPTSVRKTLAEMIGTTRSRVSYFMNKFRKLGLISYNGRIEVHNSLLSAVLHERPQLKED